MSGGHAEHAPAGVAEQVVPREVLIPLVALDAMVVAFVLQDQASRRKRQVGVKGAPLYVDRLVHQNGPDAEGLDEQPQQRFRT